MTKILAIDSRTDELLCELNNRGEKLLFSDSHVEEIEGEHSHNFTMPAGIPEAQFFGNRGRYLIPSEDGDFLEFIIYRATTSMGKRKKIVSIAAYTEMDKSHVIDPGTYTGTLEELANIGLPFTDYRLGVFEDIRIRTVIIEEHIGVYSFLVKVAKAFEVETRFRVEVSGTRFIGRYLDFVKRRGSDIQKEIVYGVDLIDMEMTEHSDRIVTELLCIGPEKADGTRLVATVRDEDAFQRWNRKGKPIIGIYTPQSNRQDMTLEELKQYGSTELKKRIDSVVEYRISAASIESAYPKEKVRLGSTLRIKNPEFEPPLYADARAIRVERSIIDKKQKTFTIGEVKTYTEEDATKTWRALQQIYGIKIIRNEIEPLGRSNTIWIKPRDPLNPLIPEIAHTFNFDTQRWEKTAPTDASEIGGVVVGEQYNGVSITPEDGLGVTRTDGLVRTFVNATEGIFIETISDETGTFEKVFFVDELGNLTFAGIIRGSEIILGGENNRDGTLKVLNADGDLSSELRAGYFGTEEARVGYLDAPNKLEYADFRGQTLTYWVSSDEVNGNQPSDENSGTNGWNEPLRTIQEAVNRIPKSFDGSVNIILAGNRTFNEEIIIAGFFGNGRITITNDTGRNTINGKVIVQKNITACTLERLRINSTDGYTALDLNASVGTVNDCIINGATGGTTSAIRVGAGGFWEVINTAMYNINYGIRATYGGNAYALDCTGEANNYAFQAYSSAFIAGGGTAPTGLIGNTSEYHGGIVKGSWTFPAPPAPPAPTPVEATKTYSANSGSGTWRADFGGLWDSGSNYGNAVTQGSWSGYGPFTGAFIFGTAPSSDVTGKTIKRIRIQITRLSGGVYAAQNVVIRPHGSTSRPSGNVSLQSLNYAAGIKVGETRWITLPSSFHAGFQNGSYKGLGINGGSYVKLSKTARLEITYE